MKTKHLVATAALLVAVAAGLIAWRVAELRGTNRDGHPIAKDSDGKRFESATRMRGSPGIGTETFSYQSAAGTVSLGAVDEGAGATDSPGFLSLAADLDGMADSPAKNAMMREALTNWAQVDGAAAANWAKARSSYQRFLPGMMQAWAGAGADSAVSAWAFAKSEVANGEPGTLWLAEGFVTSAFREMTAMPDGRVWDELGTLSGANLAAAMIGMADFASNRQADTEFTTEMEARVLDSESATLAAAFYAGAGHIFAAKEELGLLPDTPEWQTIAREVARQQAAFDPVKAIEWLQSQFEQPSDAIADMVASIGMSHALNAEDVLNWLKALPESKARAEGEATIQSAFPELRANIEDSVISLD